MYGPWHFFAEFLGLLEAAGEDGGAHLGEDGAGARVVPVARAAGPEGGFVELEAFGGDAAEDHGAEAAIADRQGLDPLAGGLVVTEEVLGGGGGSGGGEGEGEEERLAAEHGTPRMVPCVGRGNAGVRALRRNPWIPRNQNCRPTLAMTVRGSPYWKVPLR